MAKRTRERAIGRLLAAAVVAACGAPPVPAPRPESAARGTEPDPIPAAPPAVRQYLAHRALAGPVIDGRLDDRAWRDVAWTDPFGDIEGPSRPAPFLATRVKLTWDDGHLYIAAALEEPHLQASLLKRDTVIYLDNDFEVFLDPDGDTHDYFELELNALGTEWDLRLPRPYRDGGRAEHAWDIAGLRTAVSLEGTLNDPSDRDRGWSVEIAIPFAALGLAPPADGEQWRVNFSRVEWTFDVVDGRYRKRTDPATGKPLPEHNWTWSPQHAVNVHMPELWGVVQFDTAGPGSTAAIRPLADEEARWSLRRLYYAQRAYRRENGRWAGRLEDLGMPDSGPGVALTLEPGADAPHGEAWQATARGPGGAVWRIRADGLTWRDRGERP